MKSKIIRTGIAVAALSIAPITASAAELPAKAPSYSAPSYSAPADSGPARFPTKAPAYSEPLNANWTGFYIGLNAGYAFGKSNWDVPEVSPSPKGAVFGATFGYNLQTGMWL